MKTIFTTGQVAKICKCASKTVSNWFDSGRLRGYRIPGSQDRRVPRENLIRFLKENGMPLGELEGDQSVHILCVTDNDAKLRGIFSAEHFEVSFFRETFELGIRVGAFVGNPRVCVIMDLDHLGDRGASCVASLKGLRTPPMIIGFGNPAISHDGCDVFMRAPFEPDILLVEVMRLLDLGTVLVSQ